MRLTITNKDRVGRRDAARGHPRAGRRAAARAPARPAIPSTADLDRRLAFPPALRDGTVAP
jgi:hypothetical protein